MTEREAEKAKSRDELISNKVKGFYPNEGPNRKQRREKLQKYRKKPRMMVYSTSRFMSYFQVVGEKKIEHWRRC